LPWYRSLANPVTEIKVLPSGKTVEVHGKILQPITDEEFALGMDQGVFKKKRHRAYCVLVFYSGVRKLEGSRTLRDSFTVTRTHIIWNVGPRTKKTKYLKICPNPACKDKNSSHANFCKKCATDLSHVEPIMVRAKTITTHPLKLPLATPFMDLLKNAILDTPPGQRVFGYSPRTCYNIFHRAGFHYPHLARLTRISDFLSEGWTPQEIHSWTGLSLSAIDYYVALVNIDRMGESLAKKGVSTPENSELELKNSYKVG
jgi:hypothetical protein